MPSVIRVIQAENVATVASALQVTDARIAAKAEVSTLTLAGINLQSVGGICTDKSGNLYVSDVEQHVIVKISEGGKNVAVIAGSVGVSGNNTALMNVAPAASRLNAPKGLACDNSGTLYVADSGNNQIRTIRDGKISVLAGGGNAASGFTDGACLDARFSNPSDVAVDNSGVVYVADTANHSIRKIYNGQVLTIAGAGSATDAENVRASKFINFASSPAAISVDANGNLFVSDTGNRKVKKISPRGWIYLHSGSGANGASLGTGSKQFTCAYKSPRYSACDRSGNLYLVDRNTAGDSRLLRLNTEGVPSMVLDFVDATDGSGVTGVAVSPSGKLFVTITTDAEAESSSSSSSSEGESSSSST